MKLKVEALRAPPEELLVPPLLLSSQQPHEVDEAERGDWPKVTQETSWLSRDLYLDLPGLCTIPKPLHHPGSHACIAALFLSGHQDGIRGQTDRTPAEGPCPLEDMPGLTDPWTLYTGAQSIKGGQKCHGGPWTQLGPLAPSLTLVTSATSSRTATKVGTEAQVLQNCAWLKSTFVKYGTGALLTQ